MCHLAIKLGMALVVTGSGPDTPVPLAIASSIPSRSSWWRFSAGWTTVSALKGSQPLPGYLELNVWLIFMISVIQSVRDPACEMTCRSKDLLQNNSYQRRVKRTQRASQVVTNVCAEEMVTQSYILHYYILPFSCVCHGMSSRELLDL